MLQRLFSSASASRRPATPPLRLEALEGREVPAAPIINSIIDQTLATNQSVVQVPIVASDADGDPLTYTVRTAGTQAYFVATNLGLKNAGTTKPFNWAGQEERWFAGKNSTFYFLLPNGELHRWDNTPKTASGPVVAQLPGLFYTAPNLLTTPSTLDIASLLKKQLGLVHTATPSQNTLGLDEKWFAGTLRPSQVGKMPVPRYFITPNGEFYHASGSPIGSVQMLLAQLDPAYYDDTKLLTAPTAQTLPAQLNANLLQLGTLDGVAGSFAVEVQVSDGTNIVTRTFHVFTRNLDTPTLPTLDEQMLATGDTTLLLNATASDGDNDALRYSVRTAGTAAYFLTHDLGIKAFKRKTGWGGESERWFQGMNGLYFLKPSGDLHQWDGTLGQATGALVYSLPPVYYHYPDLLTKPSTQDLAFVLDQRLGLAPAASPTANSLGLDEKWLTGHRGFFFITPEGQLYRRTKNSYLWLADVGVGYYKQPARLYAASSDRFAASVDSNGQINVTTKPNFIGQFVTQVTASDGVRTTKQLVQIAQSEYVSTGSPRVVGANALNNRTVQISFSQPMNNAAIDPTNYQITPTSNNGSSLLKIVNARFTNAERTTVELSTYSQSNLNYTVAVVNVKDLGGTPLASPVVSNGVLVDPTRATFAGQPPGPNDLVDTDTDGLPDHEEQLGWQIQVKLLNGATLTRVVSSDPNNPDTDGDGLSDAQESNLRLDPRDRDTDDDQLNDFQEFNEIFSDAANQDTDGDTLDDSLEFNFFRSSPVEVDTDGDQLSDNVEIVLGNRNPRISDVPKPGIEIGAVDLRLDVRFTATNTLGSRELETRAVTSTLTQTENTSYSSTDANSNEFTTSASAEAGYSVKAGVEGVGHSATFTAEAGYTGQWTSSFTEESSLETQEEISESFETQAETTVEESVTREILGASMKVGVSITSLSNITFAIRNLQVVAFLQDPNQKGRLLPIATLLPDVGVPNEFTLGPLVPERGPFVFTSDQIFPALVQDLMLDPRGLVFKIANYDMVDERGRNFAFSSQDINDRTAPLVIDFGFGDNRAAGAGGTTERYRVATSAGRIAVDTNGDGSIDNTDRPVVFNPNTGKAVGITVSDAMQNIVGLTHYDETTTPSSTLTQTELMASYATKVINGVERLWRIRDISRDLTNPLKNWTIFTSTGIVGGTNFSDLILKTEEGLTFKFVQDLDDDGIDAVQEYVLGSSDSNPDSDGDTLTDAFEFFGRMPNPTNPSVDLMWNVDVVGQPTIRGLSSPARDDSDLDGLRDDEEFNRFVLVDDDNNPATPDISVRKSLDPRRADTDGDGVSDFQEINGYTINLVFPAPGQPSHVTRTSDPLNPDTDGDLLIDGDEQTFGTDPTVNDANNVRDDDSDGLANFLETLGWNSLTYAVSGTANTQGTSTTTHVASLTNDPDSDDDGLNDKEERVLGTNPTVADTDSDGVTDFNEVTITQNPNGTRTVRLLYNPLDADVDNDKRSDGTELNTPIIVRIYGKSPYSVSSAPLVADADADDLVDGDELAQGTDPTKFDTDEDNPGVGDARELVLGTNVLRKDQKVTITLTQFQNTGWDGDDETIFDHTLEIVGKIKVGKPGSMTTLKEINADMGKDQTNDLTDTATYILVEGETLRVQLSGFQDEDSGSANDDFPEASENLTYKLETTSKTLTTMATSGGAVGISLVLSYNLAIEL